MKEFDENGYLLLKQLGELSDGRVSAAATYTVKRSFRQTLAAILGTAAVLALLFSASLIDWRKIAAPQPGPGTAVTEETETGKETGAVTGEETRSGDPSSPRSDPSDRGSAETRAYRRVFAVAGMAAAAAAAAAGGIAAYRRGYRRELVIGSAAAYFACPPCAALIYGTGLPYPDEAMFVILYAYPVLFAVCRILADLSSLSDKREREERLWIVVSDLLTCGILIAAALFTPFNLTALYFALGAAVLLPEAVRELIRHGKDPEEKPVSVRGLLSVALGAALLSAVLLLLSAVYLKNKEIPIPASSHDRAAVTVIQTESGKKSDG